MHRSLLAGMALYLSTLAVVQAGSPQAAQAEAPSRVQATRPSPTPADLYASACAACHGPDGTGMPRSAVGFDVPLPDFTDCSFASREPDADWLAVAHSGGPARGFSPLMPAFGAALSEDELLGILRHVRTFCADPAWPRGELNLPRTFATEKAYPEDEAVLTVGFPIRGPAAVSTALVYEKRFGPRNQIELKLPVEAAKNGVGTWAGGAGDIAIGFKRAFAHSLERGGIAAVAAEIIVPTGDEAAGLSKGTPVFEPFFSYGQTFPQDSFLQAQVGVELPFRTSRAAREAFWRVAVGKTWTQGGPFGRAWSPMIELLAARELERGEPVHWDVLPQVQFSLNTRQHLMMNVGLRIPVNERVGRHPQFLVYFLWDWFDGGLFDGW